ncbi:MAG TPA: MBL fold metallo-hydrolase [Patescibacteria group bacterium]
MVDNRVLIDAGPETYAHLQPLISQGKVKLETILVTHEHPDHILGFQDLPHIYNSREINFYTTKPVLAGIKRTFPFPLSPIKPIVVSENERIRLNGNTTFEYFPVVHGNTQAFGVKYKSGKFFAYIPDFNRILPSQQKVIRGCDLLMIDGSSLGQIGQSRGHISITVGIEIAKNLKAKQIYFIHIGHKTGIHEYLENFVLEFGGRNFHISFDGLEIEL